MNCQARSGQAQRRAVPCGKHAEGTTKFSGREDNDPPKTPNRMSSPFEEARYGTRGLRAWATDRKPM